MARARARLAAARSWDGGAGSGAGASGGGAASRRVPRPIAEAPFSLAGGVKQLREMVGQRLAALGWDIKLVRSVVEQLPSFRGGSFGDPAAFATRAAATVASVKLLGDYRDKVVRFNPAIGFRGALEFTEDMPMPRIIGAFKECVSPNGGQFRASVKDLARGGGYKPRSGAATVFGEPKVALTGNCWDRVLSYLPPGSAELIAGSDVNLAVVPHNDDKDPKTTAPFPASSATQGFVACAREFHTFWDPYADVQLIFTKAGADAARAARALMGETAVLQLPTATPAGTANETFTVSIGGDSRAKFGAEWWHAQNWAQKQAGAMVSGAFALACTAADVPIDEASLARMCAKGALGGDGRKADPAFAGEQRGAWGAGFGGRVLR